MGNLEEGVCGVLSGSVLEVGIEGDIGDVSGPCRPTVVPAGLAERDHELRAALFGIEASASGLSQHRDQLTSTQVDELVNGLVAEIRRVRILFDGPAVTTSTFDLGDAIRRVVACARASGLDVTFFLPPGVAVEGDRQSAAQVLVALLDNVRRHTESSPVDVRVAVLDDVVDVFVEDRGPGIPAPLRRRVFERGVCGEETGGTGLGLHIAHRLMIDQGGSMSVRPRRGGGTTFGLRFKRVLSK
jgi:two-component system, OmpR family, sensor kinase